MLHITRGSEENRTVSKKTVKGKVKKVCKKCKYWTKNKKHKRYKCYTNACPAKIKNTK